MKTGTSLTDAEIIKAFTICANQGACKDCPLDDLGGVERCMHTLLLNALDLINRYQATINRLKAENKNCGKTIQNQREQLKACNEKIKEQQAEIERLERLLAEEEAKYSVCAKQFYKEGAKDFSERLKALLPHDGMSSEGRFKFGRIKSLDIDNLLKEMG